MKNQIINPVNVTPINVEVKNIDINRGGDILVMVYQKTGFPKDHSQASFVQSLSATEKNDV